MAVRVRSFVISASGELESIDTCDIEFHRDRRTQGGIELYVDDTLVLGRKETDTVDALWSLILTYIEGFQAGSTGVVNFPERRFTFSLTRMPRGNVLVRFTDREVKRTALGREKEVLEALTSGAVEFFNAVLNSSPKDEWSYRRDFNTATRLHDTYSSVD
ncbi:hypothetical protein ACFU99_01245 [Streptomyces sp. NPDC057654]|uniref:hypothetical protein n=1 Tax=Streptomyces sp. NPDC057654 TaxID=3346196 RepID=UPI003699200F